MDGQLDVCGASLQIERMIRLYQSIDQVKTKYGKHTLFLGSSFYAHEAAQHAGERGMRPQRKHILLTGETARKRLGLPMLKEVNNWRRRKREEQARQRYTRYRNPEPPPVATVALVATGALRGIEAWTGSA